MAQLHTEPQGERAQRDLRGDVQELLNRIAKAITAGDGDTVAKLFEYPAFVIHNGGAMAIDSFEQTAKFFGSGKAEYNKRGITDTRGDIIDLEKIGDDLVVVEVRWPYLDANGKEIGGERSDYTLLRDSQGKLRIRSILMRGEEKH
jgi:hypothetical protein